MIRILPVDPTKEVTASLLNYLQLTILPADDPLSHEGHWWVAYEGDLPVAFCALTLHTQWSDTGYLARAGVLPSHRGKGLQKRMVRVRERTALRLGWNWLVTDTFNNPRSANSLIGCGYRMFNPSNPWSFDGACYWWKRLRPKE